MTLKSPLILRFPQIGVRPEDSEELRLQKTLLLLSSLMIAIFGVLWGFVYLAYGAALAASIPLSYSLLSVLSISLFALTGRYQRFRLSQLLLTLLLPFLLMLALGGFVNSSAVVLWSFTCPVGALVFAGRRQSRRWFIAFHALVVLSALLEPVLPRPVSLPAGLVTIFFVMNLGAVTLVTFILLQYFVAQRDWAFSLLAAEQEKGEQLLLRILPREIAPRLKENRGIIADRFESASVLFADIVGFTPLSVELPAEEMVGLLDRIFTRFDHLVAKYDLEKIRTIGDNYMVAAGAPRPSPDHAGMLARLALDMRDSIESLPSYKGHRINFRIGMNSGFLVGGVIGQHRFHYDVWGDTVNVASRMESQGLPGKIQITEATYRLIQDRFVCEPRGSVDIKGKGALPTWFLLNARDDRREA